MTCFHVTIIMVVSAALSGCVDSPTGKPATSRPLTVTDLQERPVIGRLSVPLGQVAEIEATVIAGRSLGAKQWASQYLLSVARVNGRTLPTPAIMEFDVPGFLSLDLPSDPFELAELKTGERPRRLDNGQITELEAGYVGKVAHLYAYEIGSFNGIPDNLPPGTPPWAGVGFGFTSSLCVLGEINGK